MTKILLAVLVASAAVTGAAQAQDTGLSIKVGAMAVLPQASAKISTIGGSARLTDRYVPAAQIEYRVKPKLSLELICCVVTPSVRAVGTAAGTVPLGHVTAFPPTVTLKYRFADQAPIQPYAGAGLNYTHYFNASLPAAGLATAIHYGDSFGPALQVGADVPLSKRWFLNFDVKKIWMGSRVKIAAGATAIRADVRIDPWVVGTSVGFRF